MTLPGRRALNWLGFASCAGLMAYALYAQYGLQLEPCPLCVLQRVAVIALGLTFLVAALHHPAAWGRYVYASLVGLTAGGGVAVAGWHRHLQDLPPHEVPACGPGLDYMLDAFPLGEALRMVFQGSGECAEVDWTFLGLSMPAWVVICCAGLGIAGILNNLRK